MNVSPVDPDIRPIPLVISRLSVQFFTNGGVNPKDIHELTQVEPFHVAAFVHDLQDELSPPSVKQHLAAIRMLFDWLVTGHVIETNPAHSSRTPTASSAGVRKRPAWRHASAIILSARPDHGVSEEQRQVGSSAADR